MEETKQDVVEEEAFTPLYTGADGAIVIQDRVLTIQVCVPDEWSDERAEAFAERYERKSGHGRNNPVFSVHAEAGRVKCDERDGFTHLVLGA